MVTKTTFGLALVVAFGATGCQRRGEGGMEQHGDMSSEVQQLREETQRDITQMREEMRREVDSLRTEVQRGGQAGTQAMGQRGGQQQGTGQPEGMGQPGMGQPGMGQPGMGQPSLAFEAGAQRVPIQTVVVHRQGQRNADVLFFGEQVDCAAVTREVARPVVSAQVRANGQGLQGELEPTRWSYRLGQNGSATQARPTQGQQEQSIVMSSVGPNQATGRVDLETQSAGQRYRIEGNFTAIVCQAT